MADELSLKSVNVFDTIFTAAFSSKFFIASNGIFKAFATSSKIPGSISSFLNAAIKHPNLHHEMNAGGSSIDEKQTIVS
jgi:hypothetical protein